MAKYTEKFKIDLVQEYQLGQSSYKTLSQKCHVHSTMIRKWVLLVNVHGLDALQKTELKKYSLEERLAVVDYYQTNDEGAAKVASCARIFREQGAVGLRPKRKGRPSTMPKKISPKSVKLTPT